MSSVLSDRSDCSDESSRRDVLARFPLNSSEKEGSDTTSIVVYGGDANIVLPG